MIAADYAKALFELVDKSDLSTQAKLVQNLRAALTRRGHEKLLPQIYAEYQKLQLERDRIATHTRIVPERERTRVLLELYHALVNSNE
jgi:F0F1-type ATP synthase delta subunit